MALWFLINIHQIESIGHLLIIAHTIYEKEKGLQFATGGHEYWIMHFFLEMCNKRGHKMRTGYLKKMKYDFTSYFTRLFTIYTVVHCKKV